MKTSLIAIIAAVGLTTTPAFAAPAAEAQHEAKTPASTATPDTKRYCIKDTFTGTRLARKVCNTRSQWSALGVDIDKPNN